MITTYASPLVTTLNTIEHGDPIAIKKQFEEYTEGLKRYLALNDPSMSRLMSRLIAGEEVEIQLPSIQDPTEGVHTFNNTPPMPAPPKYQDGREIWTAADGSIYRYSKERTKWIRITGPSEKPK